MANKKKKKKAIDFFEIPKTTNAGIYAIVNWEDFSCYVGSTRNLNQRAMQHKMQLKRGEHGVAKMQEAKDKNRILRFVILREFDFDISKFDLLLAEYCYMLEMKYNCFDLYNTNPSARNYKNQTDALEKTIVHHVVSNFGAYRHIGDAMKNEYGINIGYMRNTKYREYFAKKEIEL